jgi:putative membrane protein
MRSKLTLLLKHSDIIFVLCIFAVTVRLALSQRLTLYIHPRYELFTIIFTVIGLMGVCAGLFLMIRSKQHIHGSKSILGIRLFMIIYSLAIVVLPPSALSFQIAQNRNTNIGNRLADRNVSLAQSSSLKFEDWAWLVLQPGAAESMQGKKAEFVGFIVQKTGEKDRMMVSRFTVTCCAIDATPVQIEVEYPDWQSRFKEGDWVSAVGVFDGSGGIPILRAENVTVVPEPEVPYAF